jgi:LysM repeat protein
MSPNANRRILLARYRALLHRYLSRSTRLGTVAALGGAILVSALALPAAASTTGGKTYTVRAGDSLSAIAGKQGLGSWRQIYDANASIKHPDLIYPGQHLVVPPKGATLAHRPLPTPQPVVQVRQWVPQQQHSSSQPRRHFSSSSGSGAQHTSRHSSSVAGGTVWDRLAQCESGGNWGTNTGNGFYGGLQFTPGSWRAAGGSGMPHQASRSEQIRVAQRLQQMQGWGAWPTCSAKIGVR